MNKTAIKNFAIWARRKLISDITYKAGMLGITENGVAQPLPQSTRDLQFFDIGTKDYAEVSGTALEQRNALIKVIQAKEKKSEYKIAFRNVVEEVAYTWFNRMIAIRFMEINDYLPSRIRVLSSENEGKLEPDFVTNPFETDLEFTAFERDKVFQLKEENKLDELFCMLFIKQCNKLSEILPGLFEQISDYKELLLNISFTDKDGIVYHLTHDISEDDFNVEKEGQVEIIGWMYQYYNTEPKDEVFALLKKNVKITKERIPAATQLFTPDWIVRYMVENSLGRLWVEGHPNESLKENWKYYMEEAEQEPDVVVQLNKIREEYAKLNPVDIKVIDPCMGSGHILVYAFEVLMQIYKSQGYIERDAAKSILQNNLYGIDIDIRAYQLAYFAVMMKARQYNRRIFAENNTSNLIAIRNPSNVSKSVLKRLGDLEPLGLQLVEDFQDAEECGSILQVNYSEDELQKLEKRLEEVEQAAIHGDMVDRVDFKQCIELIRPLIKQAWLLKYKYDIVITNPPYMGYSGMDDILSCSIKRLFPNSKGDLYAVFIEKIFLMLKEYGYESMITMETWMFLSSFEILRRKILQEKTITTLVHMPYLGKGGTSLGINFGTDMAIIRNTKVDNYIAVYDRISYYETDDNGIPFSFPVKNEYYHQIQQEVFAGIPGSPVAYWCSKAISDCFLYPSINTLVLFRQGMATSDNNRFLRLWHEVSQDNVCSKANCLDDAKSSGKKWFPYNKGGNFRRWYGNHEYYVNWENDGEEMKQFTSTLPQGMNVRLKSREYYFLPQISWTSVTTGKFSARYYPSGFAFDTAGGCIFNCNGKEMYYLALLNSYICSTIMKFLNPTINNTLEDLKKIPVVFNNENEVIEFTKNSIEISKNDWNSFETSWDFNSHPLIFAEKQIQDDPSGALVDILLSGKTPVKSHGRLDTCYKIWEGQCQQRFDKLKSNEEELNRIFIDIYGLQDELTPDVDDKDVTVRKADLGRDIRSLISYAVGCMFGRYSLDIPGLTFAGGEWNSSKYISFIPDPDNCIPITDEEYFSDDIVGRFVEFVRIVYGPETLEENLDFVASALGNKGNTSREVIRNYFLNDFYKDHMKVYQKRPIYWLFDSGKQNGFKALVYMHRWDADTVGNLRIEYLHKMQNVYEHEIETCQDMIDHGSGRDVAVATKRKEKLVKQLKECKDYDALVAHIAFSKIDIDLDDGVKVNYRKVQTGADGKFCEILANSKDIMAKEK